MTPLNDQALSGVTGRDGVALDLTWRINAGQDGTPLTSLGSCSGTGNPCKLALQFYGRLDCAGAALGTGTCTSGSSGSGEWLVMKDFYGTMDINSLDLNSATLPNTATAYADPTRFQNASGTCIAGTNSCTAQGLPALQFSFPSTANNLTESDITAGIVVGRMAVEYGQAGYAADSNGSFLGVKISDTQQFQAHADIDGKVLMYGF